MNPEPTFIADFFQDKPGQWGLRGDPYLWQEMAEQFSQTPLPQTAKQLEQLLIDAFEALTGQPIAAEKFIVVARFPRGGMSGGLVSPKFWRETAVPVLLTRYQEMTANL